MRRDQDSKNLNVHLVHSAADPWFDPGFDILNRYFGERGEMETREVIMQRFEWDVTRVERGFSLEYEMAVITDSDGDIAAVGDYSVVLRHDAIRAGGAAVVHLSHIWVNPKKPGRGILKRLMHELTTGAARTALCQAGLPDITPIILAAEMEPFQTDNEERIRRLKIFLHVGLCMVDPNTIHYWQPDFHSAADIDAAGKIEPVLLTLMLRRVGREDETETTAGEIRHIALCLYEMYGRGIRPQDMAPVYESLSQYPPEDAPVRLLKKL